jgi:hypothetical protein
VMIASSSSITQLDETRRNRLGAAIDPYIVYYSLISVFVFFSLVFSMWKRGKTTTTTKDWRLSLSPSTWLSSFVSGHLRRDRVSEGLVPIISKTKLDIMQSDNNNVVVIPFYTCHHTTLSVSIINKKTCVLIRIDWIPAADE